MANYQIASDGTIFELKGDGSISRIAKIDGQGKITGLSKKENKSYWLFLVLFLITTIIMTILYINANNDKEYYRRQYYNEEEQNSAAQSNLSEMTNLLSQKNSELEQIKSELSNIETEIASYVPFVITQVEIGNTYKGGDIETDYGNTIYDNHTMYLKPKVYYKAFCSGEYNLKTKWFRPDGSLSTGDSSPSGYSQESAYSFSKGEGNAFLMGWGNETMGHWKYGDYRLEIWYNGRCVFVKNFKIY